MAPPAATRLLRFWEWPFLAALAGFMFWVRMIPYSALVGGDRAYYIGTDPYYHYRVVLGIVQSFPLVPRWDPWTHYPEGTGTGQFSTIFDWVIAAFALATSGGDPTEVHVQRVLGGAPAVIGALLIVPFYFLAKRLLGKAGAVVASITIALLPGEFLIRSIAGYADHHVAEAAMALVGILGVLVAVERAHARRDDLVDLRDFRRYRGIAGWGVLGGLALAAQFYTWPSAILFLAILALWLTVVIVIENGRGRTTRGIAFGGAVAFATCGVFMIPVVETYWLGEFNTYGLLHVLACFGAAAWVVALHHVGRALRLKKVTPWAMPAGVVALSLAGFFFMRAAVPSVYGSFVWGLSWITGIGVQRTTLTIAEARPARFICDARTATHACMQNDFGFVAPVFVFLLIVLTGFVLWKRRRVDILLLLWSLIMYRATTTQVRFSYYVALNMALLVGWLAARIAETTSLERVPEQEFMDEPVSTRAAPTKKAKGRRTRQVERASSDNLSRGLKVAAVAAVLLLVIPGNVFSSETSRPGWEVAQIRQPDFDLVIWKQGLDWMRASTPDAGVDLGLIVARPPAGEYFEYPPEAYGVLSWWDYGHWIQTVALRPPVANPFQQAAPFASLYFTERDPARAEEMLDERVRDQGPIRYVLIDNAMATGKYGAITVWANNADDERPRWADEDYIEQNQYRFDDGQLRSLPTTGPAYTESMMGRLYDADANGLSNYRLVWEAPDYVAVGSVSTPEGRLRCLHDAIPSRACPINIQGPHVWNYEPGTAVTLGADAIAYDLFAGSQLKIFERVPGARLVGEVAPGATVAAYVDVRVPIADGHRIFRHTVTGVADATGGFELVFPYATTDFLGIAEGGTATDIRPTSPVTFIVNDRSMHVDVPDIAVLQGQEVSVAFQ